MTTKKTRKMRKKSDIHFQMLILKFRQDNISTIIFDAMCRMQGEINELQKEIEKLKEGKQ